MPQAVTHVLIALIIGSLIRDYFIKDKKKFPLHYVLLIGIGGLLPDIDILVFWVLFWQGFTISEVHRTFSHSLLFPAALFLISLITIKFKNKELGKHHLKMHSIFLMLVIGICIHLLLDFLLSGVIMPFYPFSSMSFGLDLVSLLPYPLNTLFLPSLDAVLLVLWIIYIEWKHKISDFL